MDGWIPSLQGSKWNLPHVCFVFSTLLLISTIANSTRIPITVRKDQFLQILGVEHPVGRVIMDYYSKDTPKYPDPSTNQAGLEVDNRPPAQINGAAYGEKSDAHGGRKILGLSVGVFWAIVVVCALAIGGGVGGGVGAGLAAQKNCNDNNNSSTPATRTITQTITPGVTPTTSSTPSSTRPAAASVSPAPSSPCTNNRSINGTTITPSNSNGEPFSLSTGGSQTFRIYCNTNWPGGASYGNPQMHDIMSLYAPSMDDCVAACAAYNVGYVKNTGDGVAVGGGLCRAVALVLAEGEMCYLKNGTGRNDTGTSGQARIDSALLI